MASIWQLGSQEARISLMQYLSSWQQTLALPLLTTLSDHKDKDIRQIAINTLITLELEKDQVLLIATHLKDSYSNVRRATIQALVSLEAFDQASAIATYLKDEAPEVRQATIQALVSFEAFDQAPAIATYLGDEDPEVRQATIQALVSLEAFDQAPAIATYLKDEVPEVRQAAIEALGLFNIQNQIPAITARLKDEDPEVRKAAIYALGALQAQDQILAIMARLEDEDSGVHQAAIEALGLFNIQSLIPAVTAFLKDKDPELYQEAIYTLGAAGAALQAQDQLSVTASHNENGPIPLLAGGHLLTIPVIYSITAETLASSTTVNVEDDPTTNILESQAPVIAARLTNKNVHIRQKAIEVLGILKAKDQAHAIAARLGDDDNNVRQAAIEALGILDARNWMPAIIPRLADSSASVRRAAIETLGLFRDTKAIPQIRKHLQDKETAFTAAEALSRLGWQEPQFTQWQAQHLTILSQMLLSKQVFEREQAVIYLGQIYTAPAVVQLIALLAEPKSEAHSQVLISLGGIAEYRLDLVVPYLPQLLKLTTDEATETRLAAISTLGNLLAFHGSATPEDYQQEEQQIRSTLEELANNAVWRSRYAAIDALAKSNQAWVGKSLYSLLINLSSSTANEPNQVYTRQQQINRAKLRFQIYKYLGHLAYAPALSHLEQRLQDVSKEKKIWRQLRDLRENQAITSTTEKDTAQRETTTNPNSPYHTGTTSLSSLQPWSHTLLEYRIGYAIARIQAIHRPPSWQKFSLLAHPLYQVRQGAIRGLAESANTFLLQALVKARQAFFADPDYPSPFPYASYQAIDRALTVLESQGTQEDLKQLIPLRQTIDSHWIQERITWTFEQRCLTLPPSHTNTSDDICTTQRQAVLQLLTSKFSQ